MQRDLRRTLAACRRGATQMPGPRSRRAKASLATAALTVPAAAAGPARPTAPAARPPPPTRAAPAATALQGTRRRGSAAAAAAAAPLRSPRRRRAQGGQRPWASRLRHRRSGWLSSIRPLPELQRLGRPRGRGLGSDRPGPRGHEALDFRSRTIFLTLFYHLYTIRVPRFYSHRTT